MSTSTGRSGNSQPGRRGRRRGRRGAGSSAGKDQGANPANSTTQVNPPGHSGQGGQAGTAGTSNNANPAQPGGSPDRSGDPPAGSSGKTGGRSRGRGSGKGGKAGAKTTGTKTTGAKTTGKANGKVGGKAGGRFGGKAGGNKAGGGKAGGRFGKPGGRRLRTVDETSAGGLVVDASRASAALIGRLDRRGRLLWSLPKGHIESGETPEQAAIREVAEETGIAGRVLAPLGTIDYWFVAEDRRVHKTVHHFLMEAIGGELSDEDVEVTEVAWVPLGELDGRLAYADERRLVRLATELLSESA